MEPKMPPAGWATDKLTHYLQAASENRWATFVGKRGHVQKLIGIDACFDRCAGHFTSTKRLVPFMLFVRSHAAFRGACENAMAGQATECFRHIRGCLENAAYALRIASSDDLAAVWLSRHEDPQSDSAMRKAFQMAELRKPIKKLDVRCAEVFDLLYQRSVDYGAHPNERSVTGSLSIEKVDGGSEFRQQMLHGDGVSLDFALKTTAQAGICALDVLRGLNSSRFEILGVNADLADLRAGL